MLATLKIRSHRQFVEGNKTVSISDDGDRGLRVTSYRTELGTRSFSQLPDLARTTTERSPAPLGELVIQQLAQAQGPPPSL